ncbi:hypothetical protein [Sphingomonas sp. HMP6]|uniref:hypothetical protein n=1 Tax=Sphingomonas sp. HMP6 TaxID=1517551 RepID=UPI001E4AC9E0|nr:hypothetical protein [Sphingomonas sp. HMP6]
MDTGAPRLARRHSARTAPRRRSHPRRARLAWASALRRSRAGGGYRRIAAGHPAPDPARTVAAATVALVAQCLGGCARWRGDRTGGLGGQLGGSQAGARVAYLFDRKHRIALAGRVTSPLGRGLREAAIGVEWQPTRLPIRVVAEQRFAVDGGRSGPALGMVGGIGPVALPRDFRLEAYGQAGVIRRAVTEPYADGAVRIAHPLATVGGVPIDLGAGVWGGAQRGAARLDLGPSVGVSLPLGQQRVRVMLDWRQRVAGDARLGSGAALTLGTDF